MLTDPLLKNRGIENIPIFNSHVAVYAKRKKDIGPVMVITD